MQIDKELEHSFLNKVKEEKIGVTIFLINGIKLQGIISSFDDVSILFKRSEHSQLIYMNAISTIMPSSIIEL